MGMNSDDVLDPFIHTRFCRKTRMVALSDRSRVCRDGFNEWSMNDGSIPLPRYRNSFTPSPNGYVPNVPQGISYSTEIVDKLPF